MRISQEIRQLEKGRKRVKPPRWRQILVGYNPYLVILRRHLTLSAFAFAFAKAFSSPLPLHRTIIIYRILRRRIYRLIAYCIWSLFHLFPFLKKSHPLSLTLSLGYPFAPFWSLGISSLRYPPNPSSFHSPDVFGLISLSASSRSAVGIILSGLDSTTPSRSSYFCIRSISGCHLASIDITFNISHIRHIPVAIHSSCGKSILVFPM